MAELRQRHSVANVVVASASSLVTTTPPVVQPVTQGWNVGDILMSALSLRLSGTLNIALGGGTLSVTILQALQFLASLTFGTDLHQNIIDNVDGVSLYRMILAEELANGYVLDVPSTASAATSFEANVRIEFQKLLAARGWDSVVDLLRAQPYLRAIFNPVSSIAAITGGAPTLNVGAFNMEIMQEYFQGPFVDKNGKAAFSAVAPTFVPYYAVLPVTISATTKQLQIPLPYGDRIYRKIHIFQRNSVTNQELPNTIVGANDQDRFSLVLNGARIYDNVEFLQIQKQNVAEYGAASLGSGQAIMDFAKPYGNGKIWGSRISNGLNLITPNQNTFTLNIDVTSVTNGQLVIGMECLKAMPAGAQRVVAAAAPAAK